MSSFGTFVLVFGIAIGVMAGGLTAYASVTERMRRKKSLEALKHSTPGSDRSKIIGALTIRDYMSDAELARHIDEYFTQVTLPANGDDSEAATEPPQHQDESVGDRPASKGDVEEARAQRGPWKEGQEEASKVSLSPAAGRSGRKREMDIANHPVTSREYKLMLNVDRFKDREQASQEFLSLLEFLVEKEGGSIVEEQDEEERRHTSYLDTPEGALRQQGFALRLREEDDDEEKFQINLKYRASDRHISAAQDLSSTQEGKTKFEEDILPPFISKFSHSTSIETDEEPELGTMNKVVALFPGLRELDIDENTPVETVNDFKVLEIDRKLCKLKFGQEPTIKASLSFWYLTGEENGWPLVGEFSFDYDALDSEADEDKLEMYPPQVVEGANRLFNALQKQEGWLSFNTTTKTAFALEGL